MIKLFSSSKIYNATVVLALINLILSILSVVLPKGFRELFTLVFLCMPVLWILWIGCVIIAQLNQMLRQLFFLWLLIDVSALLLFLSFTLNGGGDFTRSQGSDLVVLIMYFPVWIPFGLPFADGIFHSEIFSNIYRDIDESCKLLCGDARFALVHWIKFSIFAAPQSLILLVISWTLKKYRV